MTVHYMGSGVIASHVHTFETDDRGRRLDEDVRLMPRRGGSPGPEPEHLPPRAVVAARKAAEDARQLALDARASYETARAEAERSARWALHVATAADEIEQDAAQRTAAAARTALLDARRVLNDAIAAAPAAFASLRAAEERWREEVDASYAPKIDEALVEFAPLFEKADAAARAVSDLFSARRDVWGTLLGHDPAAREADLLGEIHSLSGSAPLPGGPT